MNDKFKTAKTIRDYDVQGKYVVPAGSTVANSTALGFDDNYRFLQDTAAFAKKITGHDHSILAHDLKYYGLNIPAEYCEPYDGAEPPVERLAAAAPKERKGGVAICVICGKALVKGNLGPQCYGCERARNKSCDQCDYWQVAPTRGKDCEPERICGKSKDAGYGLHGQDGRAIITPPKFSCCNFERKHPDA